MVKTTVYLPAELEARLNAEAAAIGVSKAELIREGIAMRLEISARPRRNRELPVFHSDHELTVDEMDEHIYQDIRRQVQRR